MLTRLVLLVGAVLLANCNLPARTVQPTPGLSPFPGETVTVTRALATAFVPGETLAVTDIPDVTLTPGGVIDAQSAPAVGRLSQAGPAGVNAFTWLPGSGQLALATGEQVLIYDVGSGSTEAQVKVDAPMQLQAVPTAQPLLAWVGAENDLYVWQPASSAAPRELVKESDPVTGLAIEPQGKTVAYATSQGQVKLVNATNGQAEQTWQTPAWLSSLAYSPDATLLGGVDAGNFTVYMLNAQSGGVQRTLEWTEHASPVLYGAYFSPNWQKLAWVARGSVLLMDVASGKEGPLLSHEDFVSAVAWSPDGSLLATAAAGTVVGNFTPAIFLWETEAGGQVAVLTLPESASSLAFSPDGTKLAILTASGQVQTWGVK